MGYNLSLCSGYGGLDMAVEALTGNKTTVYAENDPAASLVMAHRFPWAVNLGDLTAVDWAAVAAEHPIDSLSAGFSCQDISDAGPRKGISGDRSKIWKDVALAVRHIRPRLVFLENVAAIRSRGLDVVLRDLAEIGFDARWTCLRASDIGGGTAGTAGSSSPGPMFPTPRASDGPHGGPNQRNSKGQYDALPGMVVNLLPTPVSRDWKQGRAGATNSRPLSEAVLLLKTPTAQLGRNGAAQHPEKRRGGGHGPTLDDEASHLLPYSDRLRRDGGPGDEPEEDGRGEPADGSHSPAAWWGPYLAAVRRWELTLGRPAPAPTEVGPKGGVRLTARFPEWLMGLPDGWVTAVPGLTRAEQLARIGNGAMPQQAYEAYRLLLNHP